MRTFQQPFVNVRRRGTWACVALVVFSLAHLAAIGPGLSRRSLLTGALEGEVIQNAAGVDSDLMAGLAALLGAGTTLIAGLVFCSWLHGAYRNLVPLGLRAFPRGPAWAWWGFIVPVVALWIPYQMVQDTWRGSDPKALAPDGDPRVRTGPSSGLVGVWWLTFLVNSVAGILGSGLGEALWQGEMRRLDFLLWGADFNIAGNASAGIGGLLAVVIIRRISAMQEERQNLAALALL